MNLFDEYDLLINDEDGIQKYCVVLNNKYFEVSINIFLQIFGVHKIEIKDDEKRYFIIYKDEVNKCQMQLSLKEYKEFNSFKSQDIKYKNIYNRYIEHSEQSEETIQKRMLQKIERVEDMVYRSIISEEIQKALLSLNEIQRRKFVMYYIDEMTYEQIAKIEGCTKRAIKFSVDAARMNLQKMLKNLYLDYTNQ